MDAHNAYGISRPAFSLFSAVALSACTLGAAARTAGAEPAFSLLAQAIPVQAPAPQTSPETKKPGVKFPEQLLKPNAKNPEVTRKEVLEDLFGRLSGAGDEESAKLIAEAIEKIWMRSGSDTVDLLMQRSAQLVQNDKLDTALDILDSVVAIAPDYAEGWNQRATVFFVMRNFRRSLDDLRHVLALEPRHFKAISGLGLIMQEFGDKEAALKAFRKALKLYPQLTDAQQLEHELAREVEGQGI